jgi:hypothetical protein
MNDPPPASHPTQYECEPTCRRNLSIPMQDVSGRSDSYQRWQLTNTKILKSQAVTLGTGSERWFVPCPDPLRSVYRSVGCHE